jgi:hypothetical protein
MRGRHFAAPANGASQRFSGVHAKFNRNSLWIVSGQTSWPMLPSVIGSLGGCVCLATAAGDWLEEPAVGMEVDPQIGGSGYEGSSRAV